MSKYLLTIIADEDVIGELATYPLHRCLWVSEPEDVDIKDDDILAEGEENNVRKWIIEKLKGMGWSYEKLYFSDGSIMTYKFTLHDMSDKESYWEVSIEDHHDEIPSADDWIIYSSYNDPKQKDWDGHQIDTYGAVDHKAMKLFVMFVETLDC